MKEIWYYIPFYLDAIVEVEIIDNIRKIKEDQEAGLISKKESEDLIEIQEKKKKK
jgi:hypothetical protein